MLLAPRLALALVDPSGPVIEWSAPPGCPDGAQVLDEVARIMGRSVADVPRPEASIRGRIRAEPSLGFALEIEIETPSGLTRKRTEADGCDVLGSVAALMVAVAIDPIQTVTVLSSAAPTTPSEVPAPPLHAPDERAPGPEPRVDADASPDATAASGRSASDPAPRDAGWVEGRLRGSGGLGRGIVPGVDVHASLGAGLRTRRLRAELVAFHVLAQDARPAALPTVGIEVSAWGGSLRAGPVLDVRTVELSATAGISAAALTASGFGVLDPGRATAAWVALCLVPGLRWRPRSRWTLGVDVELEAALRRPAFALEALPEGYRTPAVGVRGAIVIEVRLGPHAH